MPFKARDTPLLEQLPPRVLSQILKHCDLVELNFNEIIAEKDKPYKKVYFPQTAFISLMQPVAAHPAIEIGLIGKEGMLGASLMLGIMESPFRAVVQGPGTAYSMPVRDFQWAINKHSSLLKVLYRYQYVQIIQTTRVIACTQFHSVEARLASWLLLIHDHVHTDLIQHTHDQLADMLGVLRSAVTIAAGDLQRRKLINYARGKINILDRIGLKDMSCGCYTISRYDYAKQFS